MFLEELHQPAYHEGNNFSLSFKKVSQTFPAIFYDFILFLQFGQSIYLLKELTYIEKRCNI